MAKKVVLTRIAERNYEDILDYLFNHWDKTVVDNFIVRFEEACAFLAQNPQIYPIINLDKQIRRCVLTKHNSVYFTYNNATITIITIYDTRQNPGKLDDLI